MVVLSKIKASTLMETLVATVLIIIVFMMASMILNNLFSNTIKGNTRVIDSYLLELEYLYHHDKIELPYQDDFNLWDIAILTSKDRGQLITLIEATNQETRQSISKVIDEH